MQTTFDLFGAPVEIIDISKPKADAKPRAVVMLDRREIWGEGGYLSTLEDDETSIKTTETYTENATIQRLEEALFMSPVIKKGLWVQDGTFFAYRITKALIGQREFGQPGSILRDATLYMLQASALKVLEQSYKHPQAWLPRWAYWLFCYRLRKAGVNEDPYALLKAFSAVMTQHDFLDESRTGDTMRTATKRHRMAEQRSDRRKNASHKADQKDELMARRAVSREVEASDEYDDFNDSQDDDVQQYA